jgi:L-amino acid N-acyltransferase YncA
MSTTTGYQHVFPMRLRVKDHTVEFRPLRADECDAMVAFARTLPHDDLLFLQRDITQRAEVERWIREGADGNLVTVAAWHGNAVAGYATYDRGTVRWTRHVAELRVVVAPGARGSGVGRMLLELVFELALEAGVTKLVARMTPDQPGAAKLFQQLGFEQEAVLRRHAIGANGQIHDLLVLGFHVGPQAPQRCEACGLPVLSALALDRVRLCSHCYENRYQELGGGG